MSAEQAKNGKLHRITHSKLSKISHLLTLYNLIETEEQMPELENQGKYLYGVGHYVASTL
jgi:hypothetical protein